MDRYWMLLARCAAGALMGQGQYGPPESMKREVKI